MPSRAQSRARAQAAKKPGRTTKKKVKPVPGDVVEMHPEVEVAPPPQDDGQFSVEPQRIQAKLRDKLAESEYRASLVEAAFEQSQEDVRRLRAEMSAKNARITELEAELSGAEEEDEDDDDESEG